MLNDINDSSKSKRKVDIDLKRHHTTHVTPELTALYKRASRLSLDELRELTSLVGIKFAYRADDSKRSYVHALDEANDMRVVYEYLTLHGV